MFVKKYLEYLRISWTRFTDHLLLSSLVIGLDFLTVLSISVILSSGLGFYFKLILLYFVWSIPQVFSWHITYRISEREEGPMLINYAKRFFVINTIWIPILLVATLIENNILRYLILFFVMVMTHASYVLIFKKKKAKKYVSNFTKFFYNRKGLYISLIFIISILSYFLLDNLRLILEFSPETMLIIGFLYTFTIIILTRLMLIISIEKN